MRALFHVPSVAVLLITASLAAPPALAAPTCQTQNGATIRCGTPGAMPVGWNLSPQQRLDRHVPGPDYPTGPNYPTGNEFLKLLCIMGVFFALMALLPEFDGQRAGAWGKQEGDDED